MASKDLEQQNITGYKPLWLTPEAKVRSDLLYTYDTQRFESIFCAKNKRVDLEENKFNERYGEEFFYFKRPSF